MKHSIVHDNGICEKDIGLKSDWAFSYAMETEDETIFFDTGANSKILFHNMKHLGINPKNFDKIVMSHGHWDRSGGLKTLIPIVSDIQLYRLAKVSPSETMCLIFVEAPQDITEEVYTTGRRKGSIDEQSLILKSKKGWFVLIGCSHPNVEKILHAVGQFGNIIGIVDGFHGFNKFSTLQNLDIICPCRCINQ